MLICIVYYEVELHYVEIYFDTSLCMCILPISSVFVLYAIELICTFLGLSGKFVDNMNN